MRSNKIDFARILNENRAVPKERTGGKPDRTKACWFPESVDQGRYFPAREQRNYDHQPCCAGVTVETQRTAARHVRTWPWDRQFSPIASPLRMLQERTLSNK